MPILRCNTVQSMYTLIDRFVQMSGLFSVIWKEWNLVYTANIWQSASKIHQNTSKSYSWSANKKQTMSRRKADLLIYYIFKVFNLWSFLDCYIVQLIRDFLKLTILLVYLIKNYTDKIFVIKETKSQKINNYYIVIEKAKFA